MQFGSDPLKKPLCIFDCCHLRYTVLINDAAWWSSFLVALALTVLQSTRHASNLYELYLYGILYRTAV